MINKQEQIAQSGLSNLAYEVFNGTPHDVALALKSADPFEVYQNRPLFLYAIGQGVVPKTGAMPLHTDKADAFLTAMLNGPYRKPAPELHAFLVSLQDAATRGGPVANYLTGQIAALFVPQYNPETLALFGVKAAPDTGAPLSVLEAPDTENSFVFPSTNPAPQ